MAPAPKKSYNDRLLEKYKEFIGKKGWTLY